MHSVYPAELSAFPCNAKFLIFFFDVNISKMGLCWFVMSMEMPSAQASWIHTVDFSEEKYVYIQVHIDYPTVYWCIILSF